MRVGARNAPIRRISYAKQKRCISLHREPFSEEPGASTEGKASLEGKLAARKGLMDEAEAGDYHHRLVRRCELPTHPSRFGVTP